MYAIRSYYEVTQINPNIINTLSREGFIPIIAPVGTGDSGETYNINADLVASSMAVALSAKRLIFLTDVEGVINLSGELISSIDMEKINKMIKEKTISGGMIPKIECALEALKNGVENRITSYNVCYTKLLRLNNIVIKHKAKKVRRIFNDKIIVGFAGATADALNLSELLEKKLERYNGNLMRSAVELARDWRTDKFLRRLEASYNFV